MTRPENLFAVGGVDHAERVGAGMIVSKGHVICGVPILCQDDDGKFIHQGIDAGDDLIAFGHGKQTAGAKIVLNVDHDQGLFTVAHRSHPLGKFTPLVRARRRGPSMPALAFCAEASQIGAMIRIIAFYHFTRFADPAALRGALLALGQEMGVMGTILLAGEGVNGTIAGTHAGIEAVLGHLRGLPGCKGLEWKESFAHTPPFTRFKVRLKREIVTMGQPDVDPVAKVGNYVVAQDWNSLISRPDVAVIDTRNDYEVMIGTFAGSVNPLTDTFRDFPAWWAGNKDRFAGKKIAMFCTGGIRCEKSTNYLIGQGVEDVFHLKGGILKYLEDVPAEESLWQGECYVFDGRVSVGHGLVPGAYDTCHACRRPISAADKADAAYVQGVQCAACVGEYTEADRARFRERERQIALARARGTAHRGG
jgi:UPF0176 protein